MVLLASRPALAQRVLARRVAWMRIGTTRAAITLGLLAVLISAVGSWIPSLWGDEAASVMSAQRSLPSLFRMLGHVDAVHGTYYLFLHFWVDAFGTSPFSIRFPSALAVGIVVAGVVVLGTRLGGLRVGAIAGVVCMVLPRTTYMGEEARAYAFSAACVTWLTILLVILLEDRGPRSRLWWLYAAGVAVCAYVFLFSLLFLPVHLVIVLLQRDRERLRSWWRATAAGLLLASPVIVYGIAEQGQIAFLSSTNAATFNSVVIGQWFGDGWFATLAWVLVGAAAVVAVRRRLRAPSVGARRVSLVPLALLWMLLPPTVLLTVNSVHAVYSSRYLSFATPAVALVLGWLVAQVRPRVLAGALLILIVATSSLSYARERGPYAKNGSDWAADAAVMSAYAKPGDAVLFDEAVRPSRRTRLALRAYPSAFAGLEDIALKTPYWKSNTWYDRAVPLESVLDRLRNVHTVWVIDYRIPGQAPYQYDDSTLQANDFTVNRVFTEHSSQILEYVRD